MILLAMERGELDGTSTGWGGLKSSRGDWVREKINMIVQMGTIRHPDLPDVPSWVDVAKTLDDKKPLWNVAPRVHDLELKHYVDLMLRVRAGAYSFEAANPRHEHEWQVWEDVKLLPGKMIMPGVVSHCVTLVEHPELVAQRIVRYANVVGRS